MDRAARRAENARMSDYESALQAWLPGAAKSDPGDDDGGLFGKPKLGPEHFAALARVEEWVRQRFNLKREDVVSVAEVECRLPGCPPLETVVAFWEGETRHHFKILKRVAEVESENIPYAWMKDTLVAPEGFGCECC